MKATEVLRDYKAGKKDFQGADLRGQSFEGKNLEGADFSGANIRGTSFQKANLQGTKFIGAKAGLQNRRVFFMLGLSYLASVISGLVSLLVVYFVSQSFKSIGSEEFYLGLFFLVFSIIFLIITFYKGFVAFAGAFAVTFASAISISFVGVVYNAFAGGSDFVSSVIENDVIDDIFAGTFLSAIPIAFAGIIGVAGAIASAGAGIIGVAGAIASAAAVVCARTIPFTSTVAINVIGIDAGIGSVIGTIFIASAVITFGFYIGWRSLQGDERDAWIRRFAVTFAATNGTNFQGADLTNADFTGATLRNSNFHSAVLIGTCFQKAQKLNLVRSGKTYLKNLKLQKWLIGTENIKDRNFDRLNLRGVNFKNKKLAGVSFIGADLSEANLQDADLSRAKLVQTQLDQTNFTGATLTNAVIEDWGITANTVLEGVKCDCVFTRLPPDKRPAWLSLSAAESQNSNPQRKPDDWNRNFEAGEFADFIAPLRKTLLDLYHNQPTDPRVAAISFGNTQQAHPEAELKLVSIAKTGKNLDKLHLKVATSPTADLSALHREYFANIEYIQSLSPEAQEALLIERGATLKMVLEGGYKINIDNSLEQNSQSNMSQTTQSHSGSGDNVVEDKNVNNNNSRNQNISGGTINNSGAGAFSLGNINRTVANTIARLPNSANSSESGIKDLLTQLQQAANDQNLTEDDKYQTLEQLEIIAKAGQNPQAETMQKKATRAVGFLQVIAEGLEPASKLAQACAKVLPKILLFFGL